MNEFETKIYEACKEKDYEEPGFVSEQIIKYAHQIEDITSTEISKESVADKLLSNIDIVRFSEDEKINPPENNNLKNRYFMINGLKGIQVLDEFKEYTFIHELTHAMSGIHGIVARNNNSLNEGFTEYIAKLIWRHRYQTNPPDNNRYAREVGLASDLFDKFGKNQTLIQFLTDPISIIRKMERIKVDNNDMWNSIDKNIEKAEHSRTKLFKNIYYNKCKKIVKNTHLNEEPQIKDDTREAFIKSLRVEENHNKLPKKPHSHNPIDIGKTNRGYDGQEK